MIARTEGEGGVRRSGPVRIAGRNRVPVDDGPVDGTGGHGTGGDGPGGDGPVELGAERFVAEGAGERAFTVEQTAGRVAPAGAR
ncbi:MAG: hypothetical protein ACT60Q_00005, partial [Ferrovibrionaceae bacterium]